MNGRHLFSPAATVAIALGWLATGGGTGHARAAVTNAAPPAHLTSEQDHRRLLGLLHIEALRRGPDGDPASANAANFDESKVAPDSSLPDPLRLKNGAAVKTSEQWWKRRRPEIVADFDKEVYGRVPRNVPKVAWQVRRTTRDTVAGVPVITKEIVGHVDNSAYPLISVDIQLTLTTPAKATGPVPVMIEFGLSQEALAALRKRFTDAQWATFVGTGPTWQSQVLERGWGYATLIPASIQADNGEGLTQGVIGLTNKGQPRKLDDWGALRAWAWGASRAVDYMETDKSVDAHRLGIEGLSRYGKATLVAMAYEPRLAIAFVGSSGAGGAKIARRNFGEQIENLASSAEYHWMAGNFLKYAGPLTVKDLPVDAHELIALCAPRPVLISSGAQQVEGGWVDAKGMFLGAVGAGPVYRLLGKKDLGTADFPPTQTALIDGDIAFRQHSGGHTTGPNWPTFLLFASRYIQGPLPAAAEPSGPLGIFESESDVGSVVPPGTARYDSNTGVYTLTAAGANTWYHVDAFHYLWKKVSGDMSLTANVNFPPRAYDHDPDPHRKGILMFRQTLDAGASHAALGVHGSGMTALQYRRERGVNTEDIELNIDAPRSVRIEKRGATITLFLSMNGEPLHQVGASVTMHFEEPFYIGLGAVSHEVHTTDKVEFSQVTLQPLLPSADAADAIPYSTLRTIGIDDQFRRAMVIRTIPGYMQSANWAPDGKAIYAYEKGYLHDDSRIIKIPLLTPPAGGAPVAVSTGKLIGCSGNFGISPDGRLLAVSCAEMKGGPHEVYVLPADGAGSLTKVTQGAAASFFHAWSPDSQTIAFTRGSAARADIFAIPVKGGAEVQLTRDTINDGPDYSPDGKFIYFDSSRSGTTQIWRMHPDGSDAEQLTDDDNVNSSPHVSPDGKTIAFLSQPAGSGPGIGAAALKVMASDGLIRTVAAFQGDRGSFSMYGWGDAKHLAFVSYQTLPAIRTTK
jgi:hypothetical protein